MCIFIIQLVIIMACHDFFITKYFLTSFIIQQVMWVTGNYNAPRTNFLVTVLYNIEFNVLALCKCTIIDDNQAYTSINSQERGSRHCTL